MDILLYNYRLLIIAQFFLDRHTTRDPVWSFWLESKIHVSSTLVIFDHFAEGAKSRPTILLESRTKKIYHNSVDTFVLTAKY